MGVSIIHRWGSGDEAIDGFWDILEFRVIPLGLVKLLGSGFLGLLLGF